MKTVGIIGGLGPETTSEFYLDLISSCYKKNKIKRPRMIISSVPLPYKIEKNLILKNKGIREYLPFLINELKGLEKAGADFIVMPCNSLHKFIKEMRNSVKIPIISIVEETTKLIKKRKFEKIGIMSTLPTIKNKLYQEDFEKNKIKYSFPKKIQQEKIDKIILNLLKGQKRQKSSLSNN
jgi:aspartate racemase